MNRIPHGGELPPLFNFTQEEFKIMQKKRIADKLVPTWMDTSGMNSSNNTNGGSSDATSNNNHSHNHNSHNSHNNHHSANSHRNFYLTKNITFLEVDGWIKSNFKNKQNLTEEEKQALAIYKHKISKNGIVSDR